MIESDRWAQTLSVTTYRGFIGIIGRELNFDPEKVLGNLKNSVDFDNGGKRIFLLPLNLPKFNYGLYFLIFMGVIFFLHWLGRLYIFLFWR
jgi:hypothetical protein